MRTSKKIQTIPYGHQTIDSRDIKAVIGVLTGEYLTQGPAIEIFEKSIAEYCNARYAVAFSSGTAALHGACWASGITQGDEVITTPLTFAASANCVLYCGGTVVFADSKKNSPLIDPNEIEKKITKKTRVIIPVDYSGMPVDYEEINSVAQRHNLLVIADAAHSLGATYGKKQIGKLADMTMFSFHPVKTITTGEGGMIVTNNKKFYERLVLFRTHGITKQKEQLVNKNVGPWFYEMQALGYNYRMTDIQAALGTSQAQKIEKFVKMRKKIADTYEHAFARTDIETLRISPDRTSAWHLYPVLIPKRLISKKKVIVQQLHSAGIRVQVHYIPIHLHPYYQNTFGYKKGDYPKTEEYYLRELSLPIFPQLSKKEIRYVITTLERVLDEVSKI